MYTFVCLCERVCICMGVCPPCTSWVLLCSVFLGQGWDRLGLMAKVCSVGRGMTPRNLFFASFPKRLTQPGFLPKPKFTVFLKIADLVQVYALPRSRSGRLRSLHKDQTLWFPFTHPWSLAHLKVKFSTLIMPGICCGTQTDVSGMCVYQCISTTIPLHPNYFSIFYNIMLS